jgi:hypothetical protein
MTMKNGSCQYNRLCSFEPNNPGDVMTETTNNIDKLRLFRTFALGVLTAGALSSIYITMQAGQNNGSALLVILFVLWVLSPFVILLVADSVSKHWSERTRFSFYILMILLTIVSVILYSGNFEFPGFKPAFIFLMTPLVTWLFLATAYFIFKFRTGFKK